MNKTITNSAQETQQAGFNFAKKLSGGDSVLLYGDLGFGKTTFVQGLAKGLGVKQRIISPTFIIMRKYDIHFKDKSAKLKTKGKKIKSFYHIDLYRIKTENDLEGLGLEEILQDNQALVVIEWPERLVGLEISKSRKVMFEYLDESTRNITIT